MSRRPDAHAAANVPTYRRLMVASLPRRMDAVVFLRVDIDVEPTLAWLDAHEAAGGPPVSLFQVVLAAVARTLHERPEMNRFVKGGRLWQREEVALTFAVKRRFADDARIVSTKLHVAASDGLAAVAEASAGAIVASRVEARPRSERASAGIGALPAPFDALAMRAVDALDRWGLIPAERLRDSPLHTSAMVSNLGSLGLDGAMHHLYEAGTCSIQATVGKVQRRAVVDDDGAVTTPRVLPLVFAYDDRVCDGFYAARTIERLTAWIRDPGALWAEGPSLA